MALRWLWVASPRLKRSGVRDTSRKSENSVIMRIAGGTLNSRGLIFSAWQAAATRGIRENRIIREVWVQHSVPRPAHPANPSVLSSLGQRFHAANSPIPHRPAPARIGNAQPAGSVLVACCYEARSKKCGGFRSFPPIPAARPPTCHPPFLHSAFLLV